MTLDLSHLLVGVLTFVAPYVLHYFRVVSLPKWLDKDQDGVPDVLEAADDHDGPEPTEPKES